MNRWLVILILNLGTVILIAHAAVPHHHHEGMVCYHHDKANNHTEEVSHQHGPQNTIDLNCSLKQLYVAPSAYKVKTPSAIRIQWSHNFLFAFPSTIRLSSDPGLFPLKLLSYFPPRHYTSPDVISNASRAPPLLS